MQLIYAKTDNCKLAIIKIELVTINNSASARITFCEKNIVPKLKSIISIFQGGNLIWSGVITKYCGQQTLGDNYLQSIFAESYLHLLNWHKGDDCYSLSLTNTIDAILNNKKNCWHKIKYKILNNSSQSLWALNNLLDSWNKLCAVNNLFVSICCKKQELLISDNIKSLNQLITDTQASVRLIENRSYSTCGDENEFTLIAKDTHSFTIKTLCDNLRAMQTIELNFCDAATKNLIITKIISCNRQEDNRHELQITHTVFLSAKISITTHINNYYAAYYKQDPTSSQVAINNNCNRGSLAADYGLDYYNAAAQDLLRATTSAGSEIICFNRDNQAPIIIGALANRYSKTNLSKNLSCSWRYKNGLVWEFSQTADKANIKLGSGLANINLQTKGIAYNAATINKHAHDFKGQGTNLNYSAKNSLQFFSKAKQHLRCNDFNAVARASQIVCTKLTTKIKSSAIDAQQLDFIGKQVQLNTTKMDINTSTLNIYCNTTDINTSSLTITVGASSIVVSPGAIIFNAPIINIKTSSQGLPIP